MWEKVELLGKGSFGRVHLAAPLNPTKAGFIAVKSAPFDFSRSLQKEAKILNHFLKCPEIVRCFGDDINHEASCPTYNLLLEFAPGGSLSYMIKHHPNFEEIDVQNYTRMILKGLQCIHAKGYVHCDLKPSNVLVFPSKDGCPCRLKITDFGLSKEPGETVGEQYKFHATPRYMSPESFVIGQIGVALDIWSLGCIVVEMVTKKTMWGDHKDDYLGELMCQLVAGNEDVLLPESLSKEGKDFLNKCFEIDPRKRWTASMLLNHPFIAS